MKLFTRRSPIAWGALTFGLIFAALFIYAVTTGDALLPGRRSTPSRHFSQASDPQKFASLLWFYGTFSVAGIALAFTRFVPIEDGLRTLRARTKATVQEKGLDSKPAPKWAYAFLLVFIGLIIWIGWKTMYSE